MKTLCVAREFVFSEPSYQRVIWSGDSLPCCPVCGMCMYDNGYEERHKLVEDSE